MAPFLVSLYSKPEDEDDTTVSKAEVKQIQRNLKTMPLEDNNSSQDAGNQSRDMDEVESDQESTEDTVQDRHMEDNSQQDVTQKNTPNEVGSTPSSEHGDQEGSSANTTTTSAPAQADDVNGKKATKTGAPSPESHSGSHSKLGGFSNTSAASPFANIKPTENVFGSSSSTLAGMSATSASSPFAAVEKTNVFDNKPAAISGGFGNTSAISPFATMASKTNVFGGDSSTSESAKSVFGGDSTKSVFGQSSAPSTSGISSFGDSDDSTAGSVFGAKSVLGSARTSGPSASQPSSLFSSTAPSVTSGSFNTFGAKLSKEGSFATGSFIDQEKNSQEQSDFGSLLSQEVDSNDREQEQAEEDEHKFASGAFSNSEQIDVQTGEEDEMNIYQVKAKLFADTEKTHAWKERGKGTFKVNVGRKDTKMARLVMRTDGVLRLILNVAIFPDMNAVITGEKYIRFIGIEDGKPIPFLLKVKDATVADEVVRNIDRAAERQIRGKGQGVVLKD
ncbi:hypothetical protein BG011_008591 [Mortierella polycephala]|uniref:RanBD1 domain-containing protein n=1 Tax=Mortierella polycephala TaxID=41804 RepID=A0A9P6PPN1_9FUNG|nr:hypothetical protein BG011_008591 [Mortierella polycephala]